jgi:hypothetical protein
MVTNSYTTVTADGPVIDLAAAKKQLRQGDDFIAEDELILDYSEAAQAACEDYINRKIAETTLVIELSVFESSITFARNYENDAIEKVEYYAPGATVLTLLPVGQYLLRKSNILECWDLKFKPATGQTTMPATETRDDAVIITVKQGFEPNKCPKPILQAIKLRIADFYERREDREQGDSPASNNLLRPYRKY